VPRTLAPGDVAHHLSIDVGRHAVARGCDDGDSRCREDLALVPIPSYEARIGLANRLELGVGLAGDSSAQSDLKVQLVRTPRLDLAVAPTVGGALNLPLRYGSEAGRGLFAAVPVLVGIRLGVATLVPAASIGFLEVISKASSADPGAMASGVFWTGSVAAFFPVSSRVQVGPGVTWRQPPAGDGGGQLLGGLTVALGDAPK
jgi:hypothetical protein